MALIRRINPRAGKIVQLKSLNYNAGDAEQYYNRLRTLIRRMSDQAERELKQLFKREFAQEYFAHDDSIASQARILTNAMWEKFDDLFGFKAKGIAEKVAKSSSKSSASALHISLREIAEGVTLKTDFITDELEEILNATISQNVALIKSIPSEYMTQIQGAVMRSITTGNGNADLVPFLRKYEGVTLRRARLIAHDQTRKAFTNLNRVRLERLGMKKFKWLHSQAGQEPRPLHKNVLNGKTFRFDDPPIIDEKTGERGLPGQLINCKCQIVPIISFSGNE